MWKLSFETESIRTRVKTRGVNMNREKIFYMVLGAATTAPAIAITVAIAVIVIKNVS